MNLHTFLVTLLPEHCLIAALVVLLGIDIVAKRPRGAAEVTLLLVAAYAPLHRFSAALLLLPVLLFLTLVLWFLIAYALAILAAALRDVVQIVGFFLGVGAFLSPVLFPPAMFPQGLAWVLWLNPITPSVLGFQSLLLSGDVPGAEVWIGLACWTVALAVLLDRLVMRSREQLVDWL